MRFELVGIAEAASFNSVYGIKRCRKKNKRQKKKALGEEQMKINFAIDLIVDFGNRNFPIDCCMHASAMRPQLDENYCL